MFGSAAMIAAATTTRRLPSVVVPFIRPRPSAVPSVSWSFASRKPPSLMLKFYSRSAFRRGGKDGSKSNSSQPARESEASSESAGKRAGDEAGDASEAGGFSWRDLWPSKEKLKAAWRSYGYVFVGTYFVTYVVTLSSSFMLVHNGVIHGPDVNKWLNNNSIKKRFIEKEISLQPMATNLLTAWLITKTTEPLRAAGTIVAVPLIVRYLPLRILSLLRVHIPKSRRNFEARKAAKNGDPPSTSA